MWLIIILLIIAFTVYHLGINKILGLPPGPAPLPLIGNLLSFKWNMDKVLLEWKAKYGRVFTVWLPYPMVVIGDYKLLQEHVVRNGDVYLSKKNPEQLMEMMNGGLYGLVFEDNDMVKEQRKFAMKSLHEIGFGSASLEDNVHHYADEVVNRWKVSGDKAVDVTENIMRAVGNVVWNVTFGQTLEFDNPLLAKFRKLQQDAMPHLAGPFIMLIEHFPWLKKADFLVGSPLKTAMKLIDESNALLTATIKEVEAKFDPDNTPNSYVEKFIAEMKNKEERGKELGNFHFLQLLASAGALWGAGFDTTVSILRMCILELVIHPEVQRKMQAEIDALGDRTIRYEDHKQLPYTCAMLQEVYRLGNVLPLNFLRQTTADTEIEGYSIKKGTTVLPQFSMIHYDSSEYENPECFCPERHIDDNGQFIKDPRITPFSIGKRACLGETLARMEIFVMLVTFVQHCNFTPVNKVPPKISFSKGFSRAVEFFEVKIQPRK